MATLYYVGTDPVTGEEVISRLGVEAILNSGVSRSYAAGRASTLADTKASKVYVDQQDTHYADATYFGAQDAALVPVASKGQPLGVAPLDGGGKVPQAQMPALGVGYLKGPFGLSAAPGGTFNNTGSNTNPVKVGSFPIGSPSFPFLPHVFLTCLIQADVAGRPILEAKMGAAGVTAYPDQTLVGFALGRNYFSDNQTVTLFPGSSDLGATPSSFVGTAAYTVDVWLRDEHDIKCTLSGGNISAASCWLSRQAQ